MDANTAGDSDGRHGCVARVEINADSAAGGGKVGQVDSVIEVTRVEVWGKGGRKERGMVERGG